MGGLDQILDALLLAHDTDVAYEETPALPQARHGRQDLEALQAGAGADHEDVLGPHPAALDGDASIALVGGDRDVGEPEAQALPH